jgi:hypothetical protein
MTNSRPMDKQQYAQIILTIQWYAMFLFCVGFGVKAMDSFQKMRDAEMMRWDERVNPRPRIDFLTKLILSAFICALVHGYYDYRKLDPKYEWVALLLASFLHYYAGQFIVYKVWPIIKASITGGEKK